MPAGLVEERARLGARLIADAPTGEPTAHHLVTRIAESNAHMVAIKDALGFVPVGRIAEYQRDR